MTEVQDVVRLLNMLKRLRHLAERDKSYEIKALAEEVDAAVRRLLQSEK